jgi:hypothetical protein
MRNLAPHHEFSVLQPFRAAFEAASNKRNIGKRTSGAMTKPLASERLTMSRSNLALISFLLARKRGMLRWIAPLIHPWKA